VKTSNLTTSKIGCQGGQGLSRAVVPSEEEEEKILEMKLHSHT
jgi:hypothetical protein